MPALSAPGGRKSLSPLLSIIGAWLLAYFFKGALIRVPPPFLWPFGAPPTLISRRKDGIGALPCPEVVASLSPSCHPRPSQTARAALPPPTATASRPICKFDCHWSTGLPACQAPTTSKMQVFGEAKNACAQMQRLSNFACICGTRGPPIEEALDRCIIYAYAPFRSQRGTSTFRLGRAGVDGRGRGWERENRSQLSLF